MPQLEAVEVLEETLGANAVSLPAAAIAALDALINQRTVVGARYNAQSESEVDTERIDP